MARMLCTLCCLLGVLLTLLLVLDQQELALLSLEQHPTSVPSRSTYVDPVHASRQTWLRQRDGHAHAPPPAPSPPSPPRPVSLVKHTMAKMQTHGERLHAMVTGEPYAAPAAARPLRQAITGVATASAASPLWPTSRNEMNLLDYGGIRDGVTINTDAVARSMEACAVQADQTRQRCTVHIPPGEYLTEPFSMRSHVWLRIDSGATLSFVTAADAYPVDPSYEHPSAAAYKPPLHGVQRAMIHAYNLTDIGIYGGGMIDGRGLYWHFAMRQAAPECKNSYRRACLGRLLAIKTRQPPYAVAWTGVDGGVISHLRIRNPPKAAMRVQYSHGVMIEHVVFLAKMPAPTDGLLIVSSHDVTVQRCRFAVKGVALELASGNGAAGRHVGLPIDHVKVLESTFAGGAGMVISADNMGGIQNVRISDIHLNGTIEEPMGGLQVLGYGNGGGGAVRAVRFERVYGQGVHTGIVVDLLQPQPTSALPTPGARKAELERAPPTQLSDVTFEQVSLSDALVSYRLQRSNDGEPTALYLQRVNITERPREAMQRPRGELDDARFGREGWGSARPRMDSVEGDGHHYLCSGAFEGDQQDVQPRLPARCIFPRPRRSWT